MAFGQKMETFGQVSSKGYFWEHMIDEDGGHDHAAMLTLPG